MSEIVVVGGAGWAGTELVRRLADVHADFSVISHSDAGSERLRAAGAETVVRAHLGDPATLSSAFGGAHVVYAIPPTLHQREDELIVNAVHAAEACGVQRFVYHSVMHSNTPFLRNHARKARVESTLRSTHLAWTILQPSIYAQVIMSMIASQPAGVAQVPFDIDSKIAIIDLAECAEVGVKVLTESGAHDHATYELAGPTTSLRQCVADVARARSIDLHPEAIPCHQGALPPPAQNNPESAADMISTYAHYDQHGFRGNPWALTQLLDRAPASFAAVVARQFGNVATQEAK